MDCGAAAGTPLDNGGGGGGGLQVGRAETSASPVKDAGLGGRVLE